jgi:hypothetical protein
MRFVPSRDVGDADAFAHATASVAYPSGVWERAI